MEELQHR